MPYSIPTSPAQLSHYIDGAYLPFVDQGAVSRVAPSHGVEISKASKADASTTESAILNARKAFDDGRWSGLPARERGKILTRVADLIEKHSDRFAVMECLESGKPISQAKGEVAGSAALWRFAASLAATTVGETHNGLGPDILAMVLKEPIGVVSIITPWNFPFWILGQKLPFALAAGCTCVVKPSEITPTTTSWLGELLTEAGMPPGVCNIVLGLGDPVGQMLSTHEAADMVSFTGSTAVGKLVSRQASDTLKKVALELGGKNPLVVFPDADLDQAADALVFGAYFNVGQCCNASSRAIIHEDIAEALAAKVVELSGQVRFGDPLDPATQVGAIVHQPHLDKIMADVQSAVDQGATLALGGGAAPFSGLPDSLAFEPTVLTDVTRDMAVATEEVFGPVLSIIKFSTFDEAVSITNDISYGLSAGVFSRDVSTCLAFARRAQAGTIWSNTWMDGFPEVTFGGMKQSGQGREIGRHGLEEFLEVKSVVMRIGQTRSPWVTPA